MTALERRFLAYYRSLSHEDKIRFVRELWAMFPSPEEERIIAEKALFASLSAT